MKDILDNCTYVSTSDFCIYIIIILYSLIAFQLVKIINVVNNISLLFHRKKYIFNEVIKYLGEFKSSLKTLVVCTLYRCLQVANANE